LNYHRC